MMDFTIEIRGSEDSAALPALRQTISDTMTDMELLPGWTEHNSSTALSVFCNEQLIWKEGNGNLPLNKELRQAIEKICRAPANRFYVRGFKKYASFFLALFIAFFPKCPFCWAAYMSAFGLLGADAIPYKSWYLPLAIALLLVNILAVYLTGRKHQYKPLLLTIAGAILIISNRVWFDVSWLMVAGMLLLITASAWSSLPRLMTHSVRNLFSLNK